MKGGNFIGGLAFPGEDDQVRYTRTIGLLQGNMHGDERADRRMVIQNKALLPDPDFVF